MAKMTKFRLALIPGNERNNFGYKRNFTLAARMKDNKKYNERSQRRN